MRPRRKDFCVTWKRNSCRVQCLLVQRRSRHRGYLATKSGVNGILDVGIPRTPSRGIDGAGFKVYQIDCAYIEHARCVGLAQAGDNKTKIEVARVMGMALKDQDPGLRVQVVEGLGAMDSEFANKYLIDALRDRNPFVRTKVLEVISQRESKLAIGKTAENPLSAQIP